MPVGHLKSVSWKFVDTNYFVFQASEGYKFGQNAWFESYLHNFGEVCDRIKLYAILAENE